MGRKSVYRIEDEIEIGAAIRDTRVMAGVTQARLACAIGITYQQVQNYEKGKVRIAASTLKAIAVFLDVSVDVLFAPSCRDVSDLKTGASDTPPMNQGAAAPV